MFFLPITWVHFDWSNNLETWSEQPRGPIVCQMWEGESLNDGLVVDNNTNQTLRGSSGAKLAVLVSNSSSQETFTIIFLQEPFKFFLCVNVKEEKL